jgi:hypothetical protein
VRLSADGTLATLIACRDVDVDCRRPVIAPDGERIAYERMVMNGGDVPDVPEAPEIWLWQDDETYLIAQGIQPAWDDEGELRYQSLEATPESTVTPHDSNDDGTQGAYLAQEEGVQRVYVWRDTPTMSKFCTMILVIPIVDLCPRLMAHGCFLNAST